MVCSVSVFVFAMLIYFNIGTSKESDVSFILIQSATFFYEKKTHIHIFFHTVPGIVRSDP